VVIFLTLSSRPMAFATKIAERHIATLADGSRIELNAQTELTVELGRHERYVRLARGEALFSVAKDPARPFVVETRGGVVRVTGTIFNVRAARDNSGGNGPARVEVTVLEGHVRVHAAQAPATEDAALTLGQQASMTAERVDLHALAPDKLQDVVAWRKGEAVFDDTPLREVMERFAAYHPRAITVAADVADIRLGGRYSLDDLEGALEAIERALPVRVERGAAGAVKILASTAR
jgi:transmembrane sensor